MTIHGKYNVELIDNILFVKLSGSFNCAGTEAYVATVKQYIAELAGQPFAMLIDDLDVEGGTPEAYQKLNDYNEWLVSQPIVGKAFIIKSLAIKEIVLERTPSLKQQQIEFFQDVESAEQWLRDKLR
ncbi:hypothetical protein [Thalassotalea sp. G2M2-11]|uniref:hypothetical protein n=1 Tax=Thalassotalea sp. G2M2-11 TaxID=2787627 RepID=UPI0019D26A83|nr:hypothetical protein [Thalassotalea sp. G2M2-11]